MTLHRSRTWSHRGKPSHKLRQGMCKPMCGGTYLSKYHQQKQEGMGWKFKIIFCNSLGLFPLAFIKLSYLICNGFHLVAFIPQGSNNVQLPPFFFLHDSSLVLTGYDCFIAEGLKKSDRDKIKIPMLITSISLTKMDGAEGWKCGSNGLSNKHKQIEPKMCSIPSGLLKGKQQQDVGINLRPLTLTELEAICSSKSQSALGMLKGNTCLERIFKYEEERLFSVEFLRVILTTHWGLRKDVSLRELWISSQEFTCPAPNWEIVCSD